VISAKCSSLGEPSVRYRSSQRSAAFDDAAQWFEAVDVTAVVSDVERTADELLAHFRTTSLYFQIDPDKRRAFEMEDRRRIAAEGGSVHFSAAIVLMTARRSGASVTGLHHAG
jgi:hypothetical protein